MTIEFFCAGKPVAQGSLKAFTNRATGRAMLTSTAKDLKPWRASIAAVAMEHCKELIEGPVGLQLEFVMPRVTGLPKTREVHHTKRPDLDKLIRGANDAMSSVVYQDDALITFLSARKRYALVGEQPGVHVKVFAP